MEESILRALSSNISTSFSSSCSSFLFSAPSSSVLWVKARVWHSLGKQTTPEPHHNPILFSLGCRSLLRFLNQVCSPGRDLSCHLLASVPKEVRATGMCPHVQLTSELLSSTVVWLKEHVCHDDTVDLWSLALDKWKHYWALINCLCLPITLSFRYAHFCWERWVKCKKQVKNVQTSSCSFHPQCNHSNRKRTTAWTRISDVAVSAI